MNENKKIIISVLFTGAVVLLFALVFFSRKPAKKPQQAPGLATGSVFSNGQDWKDIALMPVPNTVKGKIYEGLLKVTAESSAFSGNPLTNPNISMSYYIGYVDNVYKMEENKLLPIFFAFRIADMAGNGADNNTISNYRNVVMEKLKSYGIIKK